jgi:CspA family cold shock protein
VSGSPDENRFIPEPLASPSDRLIGSVKWWSDEKGYGFITGPDGFDVFVHFTSVDEANEEVDQAGYFKDLKVGERVEFQVRREKKVVDAARVRRIERFPSAARAEDRESSDEPPRGSSLAIALLDGRLQVVELEPEGRYRVVDPHGSVHSLLYVASEAASFREAFRELEDMLNGAEAQEADFQRFFELHPELIIGGDYIGAHPHVVLSSATRDRLIPDFILEPASRGRLCDLLELKLPNAPVVVGPTTRPRLSAVVASAYAQLRAYREYFESEQHRSAVREEYGLEVFRPAMFVLIGRRAATSPLVFRRAEETLSDLRIVTYDDVMDRIRARLR